MPRTTLGILLIGLCWLCNAATAAEFLPPKIEVAILIKTLNYDTNLAKLRKPKIRIGLVCHTSQKQSCARVEQLAKEFSDQPIHKISEVPLEVEILRVGEISEVATALKTGVNMLYLQDLPDDLLAAVIQLANQSKAMTLSGNREDAKRGVALGIVPKNDKSGIVINVNSANLQGASFDARLLRLAEIY